MSLASAVALAAATGVLVVGCSDDDPVNNPPGVDSGKPDTSTPTTDAGSDVTTPTTDSGPDAPPAVTYPKLSLVHAGGGVGAVSFCMGVTTSGSTTFALDDVFPVNADGGTSTGLPPGAGGPLVVDPSRASLIPGLDITPFAIPTTVVAAGGDAGTGQKSCKALVGNPEAPNAGVIRLNTIPKGTLKAGHAYIGAVIGCPGGGTGSVDKCGTDWVTTTGNVKIALFEVDRSTAVPAGSTGLQFLHLSPAGQNFAYSFPTADGGATTPAPIFANGIIPAAYKPAPISDAGDSDAADAAPAPTATLVPLSTTPVKYGGFPATQGAALPAKVDVPGISGSSVDQSAVVLFTAAGPSQAGVPVPLSAIVKATLGVDSTGAANPPGNAFVQDGKAYTVVAVGDPAQGLAQPTSGAFFFRLILLQNDPKTTP